MRYRAASASAYKWEFVGGSALRAPDTGSGAWMTLVGGGTVFYDANDGLGPSVVVPRAGEYRTEWGARCNATAGGYAMTCPKFGSTALNTDHWAMADGPSVDVSVASEQLGVVPNAGETIKIMYSAWSTSNAMFQRRFLSVTPVRIS